MATSSAVAVRNYQPRLKYILFAVLVPMFIFVLWHDERFIVDHTHPNWSYYFPVRWLIIPHALAGLTALLIGPFQLSTRFRARHLRVHRIMGRVYLSAVAVAALMGMYLAYIHQRIPDRLWVFALATAWLVTGGMALAAVLNGNIEVHRQWVTRNYAFTSVFVTVRVLAAIPVIARNDAYGVAASWTLLLATLLFTEIGLSWRNVFTDRRARAAATLGAAAR